MSNEDETSKNLILSIHQEVAEIDTYRFVAENGLKVDLLIGASKLLINKYLKTDPKENPKTTNLLNDFMKLDSKNHFKSLSLIMDLHENIQMGSSTQPNKLADVRSIVASLLNSIWHYTFMYYYQLENQNSTQNT